MRSFEELLLDLHGPLVAAESLREVACQSRRQGWISIMVTVLVAIVGSLIAVGNGVGVAVIVVMICALTIIGFLYHSYISVPFQEYRQHFKETFIGPLLQTVADQVRYDPSGDEGILDEYWASELYPQGVDRHHIEDTIFGRVGATDIILSELHTEYQTTSTDSKGHTTTHWHTIFRGLFISADFHKDFAGTTFVRTDVAESTFGVMGRLFQKPIFSSLELVQLEDPEFEREFVVQASDQVEARYILSTSLMQRMVELKHRFSSKVEFSFVNSRMFIAISTSTDFFEPHLNQSLADKNYLRGFVEQMYLCLGVVEELGLNVRIWTKRL